MICLSKQLFKSHSTLNYSAISIVQGLIVVFAVQILGLVAIVAVSFVAATVASHSCDSVTHAIVVLEVGVVVMLVFVSIEIRRTVA